MRVLQHNRSLVIRPYERRDLSATRDLVYYNFHAHTHLDWQTVDEFLREDPPLLWVAYRGTKLVGVLGASDVLRHTCWLRIAAAEDSDRPKFILREMWSHMCSTLRQEGAHTVAVLVLRDWFESLLREFQFTYIEDVVTLRRYGRYFPSHGSEQPHIRRMELEDVSMVKRIDHLAFTPPWQMSKSEVRQGVRIASYGTLASVDGQPVGYQITTKHGMNGHLARLAVLPDAQGQGVGSALMADMLTWFEQRNILSVTVNTQASNIRSQKLYEKYQFQRNGYDLPVWMTQI